MTKSDWLRYACVMPVFAGGLCLLAQLVAATDPRRQDRSASLLAGAENVGQTRAASNSLVRLPTFRGLETRMRNRTRCLPASSEAWSAQRWPDCSAPRYWLVDRGDRDEDPRCCCPFSA